MDQFWAGFENFDERLRDINGKPMMLKLKDWPTSADFRDILRSRYDDLIDNLPIKEFTQRDGQLNLASYLPEFFLRPDLGPKLYIAYSSAFEQHSGTTNLHLDISDAVNIMMYVGDKDYAMKDNPDNETKTQYASRKDRTIEELLRKSNCDEKQINRYVVDRERPGALWHIFRPEDANSIRSYLAVVS